MTKPVVTNLDVDTAVAALAEYKKVSKAARAAEKARDEAMIVIFGKLLGVKTMDELRLMKPDDLNKKMAERFAAKEFTFEPNANLFQIAHEKDQVRPNWKSIAYLLAGEEAAETEAKKTPRKYSYSVTRTK
jgi:hypothetical protein